MRGKVLRGVIISHRRIYQCLVMGFLKGPIIRGGMFVT